MKVKMTVGDLILAKTQLGALLNSKIEVPIRASLDLSIMFKKLTMLAEAPIELQRGIVTKYGTKEDGGYKVEPLGKNWEAFIKDNNELMAQTLDVDVVKVTLPFNVAVSAGALVGLIELIDVAPEVPKEAPKRR